MIKNKLIVFFTLQIIVLFFFCGDSSASPRSLLNKERIDRLDTKGRVYLAKMLDDGRMIFCSESGEGRLSIIIANSRGSVQRRISIPASDVSYVSFSDDGNWGIASADKGYSFYHIDLRRRRVETLFQKEKGRNGFALMGGGLSWISYSQSGIFASGFFYNREGLFVSEDFIQIDPHKRGIEVFKPVEEISLIKDTTAKLCPQMEKITFRGITGSTLLYTAEGAGVGGIFMYNMEKNLIHRVDSFNTFLGLNLSADRPLMVYALRKTSNPDETGEMILYDLDKKTPVLNWEGRYFHPVLSKDADKIAVGFRSPIIEGRYINRIKIIDIMDDSDHSEDIIPSFPLLDWKFVNNDRNLYFYTGEEIFVK